MAHLGDEIMLLEGLGDAASDFGSELAEIIRDLQAVVARRPAAGPRAAAIHSLHRAQLAAALDYKKAVGANDLQAAHRFFAAFAASGEHAAALSGQPVQAGVGGFLDDAWSYVKDTGEAAGNSITAKIKGDVIEELGGSRPSGSTGVTVTTTQPSATVTTTQPSALPADFYTNPIYGIAPPAGATPTSFLDTIPTWAKYAGGIAAVALVGVVAWKSM